MTHHCLLRSLVSHWSTMLYLLAGGVLPFPTVLDATMSEQLKSAISEHSTMQRSLRDLFVDRSQHTNAFRKMLEGQTGRCIMLLEADVGMGKSWLLQMFAHEAKSRSFPL